MTDTERREFMAHLQATALIFRRRLNDATAAAYANAMPSDIAFDRLIGALDRLARTAEDKAAFPLPRALAEMARGAWHRPTRNLTDLEADRIRQYVFAEMTAWEHSDGRGSARPVFDRVWSRAVVMVGVTETPALTLAKEATWQAWLGGGLPLTRDRLVELLADTAAHASPSLVHQLRGLVTEIEASEGVPVERTLDVLTGAVRIVSEPGPSTPRTPVDTPPTPVDVPVDTPPTPDDTPRTPDDPPPPLAADDVPSGPTWTEF